MGLLSTLLSVLKMIYDQPILVEIQQDKKYNKDKNKDKDSKISVNSLESIQTAKRVRINRSGVLNFN